MLKIFTLKFEERLESFDDSILSNFLGDKKIIRWEAQFFERKTDPFWTIVVEYRHTAPPGAAVLSNRTKSGGEKYKEILSEKDWPLFERLREWRGELSKKEGIPPYIVFTNMQLARIAVTRPASLNALQQIDGIGNAKREKYGNDILQILNAFGLPVKEEEEKEGEEDG